MLLVSQLRPCFISCRLMVSRDILSGLWLGLDYDQGLVGKVLDGNQLRELSRRMALRLGVDGALRER